MSTGSSGVTLNYSIPEAKPEPEVNGKVSGFMPGFNRVLVKLIPMPEGVIIKPDIAEEQSDRGYVLVCGDSDHLTPPVGAIAKVSKFSEPIHFDDEGHDKYLLVWLQDVRGWHNG